MHHNALRIAAAAGFLAVAACGSDLSLNQFPRIELQVEGTTLGDSGGEVQFDSAVLQSSAEKSIRVINPGNESLSVTSIDWKRDPDTGLAMVNPYITLELPAGQQFPVEVLTDDAFGLTFKVRFTPPLGHPVDDFSSSVLVIDSNARDAGNKTDIGPIEITFGMQSKRAVPIVVPKNYAFRNATVSKPETQTFRIMNDPDLATAPFTILDVRMEQPSDEFILSNIPNSGTVVVEPTSPDESRKEVPFDVTYAPQDEGADTNKVIVETDAGIVTVPLSTDLITGNYSVTSSCSLNLDFSTLTQCVPGDACGCVRRIVVYAEGPGPITLDEPSIEPIEARQVFSWKAFKPQTSPDVPGDEVTNNFPRALTTGGSLEFEVTYAPKDFAASPNGELIIPISTPDTKEHKIPIFAGQPKPVLDLAPKNKAVVVAADIAGGETGTRHAVIYNNGNGDLHLKSVGTEGKFGGVAEVFSVSNAPAADTFVPPGELIVLDIAWDASKAKTDGTTTSEGLRITYVDGLTGEDTDATFGLNLSNLGEIILPTANPGTAADYAGATAGAAVTLNGSGSEAGSYSFGDIYGCNCFYWYLVDKPAGSNARLNAEAGAITDFIPDSPGDYTVELVVYAKKDNEFVFSDPATVTFTVAAP